MKDSVIERSAQRKIPVVFNIGQKKGSISGRHRHKAGIANGQQTVQWTFAVSGALWRSSTPSLQEKPISCSYGHQNAGF